MSGVFRPSIEAFDSLILQSLLVCDRRMLFEHLNRVNRNDMLVLERDYASGKYPKHTDSD